MNLLITGIVCLCLGVLCSRIYGKVRNRKHKKKITGDVWDFPALEGICLSLTALPDTWDRRDSTDHTTILTPKYIETTNIEIRIYVSNRQLQLLKPGVAATLRYGFDIIQLSYRDDKRFQEAVRTYYHRELAKRQKRAKQALEKELTQESARLRKKDTCDGD